MQRRPTQRRAIVRSARSTAAGSQEAEQQVEQQAEKQAEKQAEHRAREAPACDGDGRSAPASVSSDTVAARRVSRKARASDDALVSFEGADPFDPHESFDAHDSACRSARGIAAGSDARDDHSGGARASVYSRTSESAGAASGKRAAERPARSLKARSLAYLSRREYSRAELARKLAPYEEADGELDAVLDSLEREGWLSDERFAQSLVHRRGARIGAARIVSELKRHEVGEALVESVGAQLRETEFARAQAVWRKKFGALPQTSAERAKQARFLASRGFSQSTIVKLLKVGDDEFGDA